MNDYKSWYGFGKAEPGKVWELDSNGRGDTDKPVPESKWGPALKSYLPKSGGDFYVIRDIKESQGKEYLKLNLCGAWDGPLPGILGRSKFTFVQDVNNRMVSDIPIQLMTPEWKSFDGAELEKNDKSGEPLIYVFKIKLVGIKPENLDQQVGAYWCWRG